MSSTQKEPLVIAEEPLTIQWNDLSFECPCRITFDLIHGASIITDMWEITSGPIPDLHDRYSVQRKTGESFDVFPTRVPHQLSTGGDNVGLQLVPQRQPILVDDAREVRSVEFAIPNFGDFHVQHPGRGAASNHIELRGGGWMLQIGPVGESDFGDLSAAESMAFSFTHAGRLAREGGEPFSCTEAHEAVRAIGTFLSFCRGRSVAPAVVRGFDDQGRIVMQEWGSRTVDPYTEGATWLDRMQAQEMAAAFPGFLSTALDEEWREALQESIYWYTKTNGTAAGIDGSVVLIQAALERLAWRMLVQRYQVLSQDGFTRLPAADQLRLVLSQCSLPLPIPPGLKALSAAGRAANWTDGPQALVEIRNSIVHPPKPSSPKNSGVFWDAWRLGEWYLELTILRIAGFNGKYSNRTREHQYVGSVEPTPWNHAIATDDIIGTISAAGGLQ